MTSTIPAHEPVTSVLLIRHGEASYDNPESTSSSEQQSPALWCDPELTVAGNRQAVAVADHLKGLPVSAIYVSTLKRAIETARPLADHFGFTPTLEPDLREVHLGEWECGIYRLKIAQRDPLIAEVFSKQTWDVIPGAEEASAFAARVNNCINRLARAHLDETIVLFTHAGTIAQALSQATSSEPFAFLASENGSISELSVTSDTWWLRRFNQVPEPPHTKITDSAP